MGPINNCGLGLYWPILGAMLAQLRVMLAHFEAMLADLGAYIDPC